MNPPALFALIDCNNFFVSCERLFRPDIATTPTVVLSSNDGCVVARSNEAKTLGIPMGAPAFKWRDTFRQHKVQTFSANFELYGDISKRITSLLTTVTPRIEIYSVDESFLDISALPITDYTAWGREVRASILRHIGVPVSIGIAPSKTLAKLASDIAKKHDVHEGAVCLEGLGETALQQHLEQIPVGDVWGVGWRLGPKLRAEGIGSAWKLRGMRPQHAQQLMGIRGRQMVTELNGTACYGLTREHEPAKSIMRSRTFGEDTNQLHVMESAIASMATSAAFALRREGLLAKRIGFFTNTNRHKPGYRQWSQEVLLDQPTADTGHIITRLVDELAAMYVPEQQYHRLGVFLYDLLPDSALQTDLLGHVNSAAHDRSSARMAALDLINKRHGKGKIYYASQDLSKSWQPKQQIRSPRYVSDWSELPEARIV